MNDEYNEYLKNYFINSPIAEFEKYLNFDEKKKETAKKLSSILKENIESVLKDFYDFNLNNEKTKKFFHGSAEVERLMKTNRNYIPYLFSGPFDIEYYSEKIKIGYLHFKRGIPNDAYLASLGTLSSAINKIWKTKFSDIIELFEAQSITTDLLFIEVYFTINTYYSFLEKKLVNEETKVKEILNNIKDAYFIIDKNLIVSDVVSRSCHIIFETDIAGKDFPTVFTDPRVKRGDILFLAIKQYFENLFNLESIFNMFPSSIEFYNKTLKLSYTPILNINKKPEKIVICATDISEHIKNQQVIEDNNAKNISLIKIIKQKNEFENMLKTIATKNITLLDCDDIATGKTILHEYKNLFASFGLLHISSLISNLELELLAKEHVEKFNVKEFLSLSCCMISDLLKKYLEENYDILGIAS